MGACASLHKGPDSVVGLRLGVETKKCSPAHPDQSPSLGSSKNEVFFDSQAWLDSDCEDFYSVNGDFTPSRGTTPLHVMATPGRGLPRSIFANAMGPEVECTVPSPRKKLGELFRENAELDKGESGEGICKRDDAEEKGDEGTLQCCLPALNRRSPCLSEEKK